MMTNSTPTLEMNKHQTQTVNDMIAVLKAIKLTNKSASNYITEVELVECLSLCEMDSYLREMVSNHLSMEILSKATLKKMAKYSKINQHSQEVDRKFKLTDEVKDFFKKFQEYIENGSIQLPMFGQKQVVELSTQVYQKIKQNLSNLPTELAHDIAKTLTTQLASPTVGSTHISLHGTPYDNMHHVADDVANALIPFGYQRIIPIDCSRFDGQAERFVFCGSQSVWSGSRAGLITEPVYNNPKSIVILYNIDKANPEITYCLLSALQNGIMIDEYGLKGDDDRRSGREPTIVNFEDVIFITTNTLGYEEYHRKSFQKQLQENPPFAKSLLLDKLRQSTRVLRGKTIQCYDSAVLAELSKHWLMINPHQWQYKLQQQKKLFQQSLINQLAQWNIQQLQIDDETLTALVSVYLLNQEMLQQTSDDWAKFTLNQLLDKILNAKRPPKKATIVVKPIVITQIENFLSKIGNNEPQSSMLKRGLHLVPTICHQRNNIILESVQETVFANHAIMDEDRKIRLQMDYPNICLNDVKGHEEIKNYLQEIHYYLKNSQELHQLGVSMPKGVLLYGRAGTGKTMLAKALAGESELPFVTVTGSDLLRPENMNEFLQVVDSVSPCVVFIDEADGLGSREESSVHTNAINQLLPFIEGFHTDVEQSRFFVLASNYPDNIDKALLRAGRIEDRFEVGDLNRVARQHFLQDILPYFDDNVSENLALILTSGLNGSEMTRLHRATVLQHLKNHKKLLNKSIFINLIHQVRLNISPYESKTSSDQLIAIHEVGHAFLYHYFGLAELNYISLIGNDEIGGYVNLSQSEDSYTYKKHQIKQMLSCHLGGYACELVMFGETSLGAVDDLEKATKRAWVCINHAGLDDESGMLNLKGIVDKQTLTNNLEEKRLIICEQWLQEAKNQAIDILSQNKDLVQHLADKLIAEQVIDGQMFQQLIHDYQQGDIA